MTANNNHPQTEPENRVGTIEYDPEVEKRTTLLEELARLSPGEYEDRRKEAAKELGWRASILDKEVEDRRKETAEEEAESLVEELEPWPEPVETAELLRNICGSVQRYLILPDGGAIALALWILGTYAHPSLFLFPRVLITSPQKRCGKTTLLKFLNALVSRALFASNISSASIYRVVEACFPTLLIDEADTFLAGNDELRGIVNSGQDRDGAFVIRCEGDDNTPVRFSTWAPMAIAAIGEVGGTIHDRSVIIQLRRKVPGESVEKIPIKLRPGLTDIRRQLLRWGNDYGQKIAAHSPTLPKSANDRALDNWTPLLSIAELAGDEWAEKARDAFRLLIVDDDDSVGPEILNDIRELFVEESANYFLSKELAEKLNELEEGRWHRWNNGRGIDPNGIAKLLKPFGIRSTNIKTGSEVRKGYRLEKFKDAFGRYLLPAENDPFL